MRTARAVNHDGARARTLARSRGPGDGAGVRWLACLVGSHLLWNWTSSLPLGLYWLSLSRSGVTVGTLVACPVPEPVRALVTDRKYLPPGALLSNPSPPRRPTSCAPTAARSMINGAPLGAIRTGDHARSALPHDALRPLAAGGRSSSRRICPRASTRAPSAPCRWRRSRNGDSAMVVLATDPHLHSLRGRRRRRAARSPRGRVAAQPHFAVNTPRRRMRHPTPSGAQECGRRAPPAPSPGRGGPSSARSSRAAAVVARRLRPIACERVPTHASTSPSARRCSRVRCPMRFVYAGSSTGPGKTERTNRRACVLHRPRPRSAADFADAIGSFPPPSAPGPPRSRAPRSSRPHVSAIGARTSCSCPCLSRRRLGPPPCLSSLPRSRSPPSLAHALGRASARAAKGPVCLPCASSSPRSRVSPAPSPTRCPLFAEARACTSSAARTSTWCAGHILQTAPPEATAGEYKTGRLDHLPIVPRDWRLEVAVPELLKTIARLLKTAARVVHAGDPDREGQLLVDEVLHFLGYRGPVDRLLVRDLSTDAMRRQLDALEPNAKYRPLSESALARQRADWLYGMNMTRLYTLLGRAAGYEGVLSVGRVQTPLLGLIVARDRAIDAFRPAAHHVAAAEVRAGGKSRPSVPPDGAHLDEDRRLLRRIRRSRPPACGRARRPRGRVRGGDMN